MEAIGTISNLQGTVHAEADDGSVRALAQGSPIYAGDEVITAKGANVEILFKDETILAQGEDSRQEIDSYVYDPQDADSSNLLVNMTQGTFRLVTGKIAKANPEGVDVKTPLATIGIRGTGVDFDLSGAVQKIGCFLYDNLDIVITTAQGTRLINAVNQILNVLQGGQFGEIRTYEQFEKAFFKAAAPIINLPPDAQYGGEGEGGGEGGDGTPGQWGPDAGNTPGQDLPDPYAQALVDLFEAVFGNPANPTGMLAKIFVVLVDVVDPEDPIDPDDFDYLLGLAEEVLAGLPAEIIDPDSDGTGLAVPPGYEDGAIEGTSENDFICGETNPTGLMNFIRTYDGTDEIYAEEGNDIVYGGAGNDSIYGDAGDDTIYGGLDNDEITGGSGNDVIRGGSGDDIIYGGEGDDTIEGNDGNDFIKGDSGDDLISGGEGDDTIYGCPEQQAGETDNDTIDGGAGNDFIYGQEGIDVISGGDGNDVIEGGLGVDFISGGAGSDYFVFTDATELGDVIYDFVSGTDVLMGNLGVQGLGSGSRPSVPTDYSDGDWQTLSSDHFLLHSGAYIGDEYNANLGAMIVYDSTGNLWFDPNAGSDGDEVLIANLNGATLTADDILVLEASQGMP